MEAQYSAGVSGNSATEVEVTIYDGTAVVGTVIAVDGQWTFGVPAALSLGNHSFQARCAQAQSAPWSLNVVAPFRDFTDFQNQSWGGWVPGPVGTRLVFNPQSGFPGHYVLLNMTYDNNSAGVVLQKTLSGLHVGMRYRFEVGAGQIITPGKTLAKLSLSSSAGQVTEVFTPPYGSIIFGGEFVANSTTVTVSIVSHEASGEGNDYYFSHLLVNSV
jgi:hypothetical protein